MLKLDFMGGLATAAVAALAITLGSAAPARADAPFCSENYSRAGLGRVCAYYTYEQCRQATSGVRNTAVHRNANDVYGSAGTCRTAAPSMIE